MLSMISIAVIPVVVLGSFCYQYFSKVLLNNVQQRELQNNNQIIYSLDDFFNSLSKISDSLLMNEELTRILQNTYQGPEAQLQNYRDKRGRGTALQERLLFGQSDRDNRDLSRKQRHVLLLHQRNH